MSIIVDALIPARGGSKGLKRKNLCNLAGVPLLAHSILAALKSKYLRALYVSSEDEEILQVARHFGAQTIERPMELASDHASTSVVMKHFLQCRQKQHKMPDYLMCLQPTSPLRDVEDIDRCIEGFLQLKAKSALSVSVAKKHPYKSFRESKGKMEATFGMRYVNARRQDLPLVYDQNGAIYLVSSMDFLDTENFFAEPLYFHPMPEEKSIDIDSELDLLFAGILLEKRSCLGALQ